MRDDSSIHQYMHDKEADLPLREGRRGQAQVHIQVEEEELAAAYYDALDKAEEPAEQEGEM